MDEEFRMVWIEKYGFACVNRSGTCVIGKNGKPLSLHWRSQDGYVWVKPSYRENGKSKKIVRLVHRLVAMAFVENPDPEHCIEVNHIDGNKENNAASNLEWCTHKQNIEHCWRTGLKNKEQCRGVNNGRHILDEDGVHTVRSLFEGGMTRYRIAKLLGLGWTTVDHVIKGDTWAFVN